MQNNKKHYLYSIFKCMFICFFVSFIYFFSQPQGNQWRWTKELYATPECGFETHDFGSKCALFNF